MLSSGEKRTLACTQFEPTDARKAFRCFDEPNMKANFTISIVHDSKLRAVSNMPSKTIASKRESNMIKAEFTTSVRMSTYLVAFIVSDFVSVTGQTKSGLQVRSNEVPSQYILFHRFCYINLDLSLVKS